MSSKVNRADKQTEIGIIPEDWDVLPLSKCAGQIARGASPRPIDSPHWFDESSNVGWVRISDVTRSRRYLEETTQKLSDAGVGKSRFVKSGSLIMSICATVGRPIETRIDTCIHDGFVVFCQPKIDQSFLYHVLAKLEPTWADIGQTGSQMNLNTEIIKSRLISYPKNVGEQEAIATALSDMDALISGLDQLIAKKRDIKKATMQQLLTGQTRLPGFSGEWSTIRMSKHASLKARIGWQALTTSEYMDEGDYYLVTGTDFIGGRVNWSSCHYVDQWRYDQDRNIQLRDGDVLLTKDGTIGKVGYVDGLPGPATLNSGVFVIRPLQESFFPLFLFYVLKSKVFDEFLTMITAGSTIVHLYQKDFVNFEFVSPSIEEQRAIATLLSDMDAELAVLEARRGKFCRLKQGMMQELLTGRIRLV